MEEIMFAEYSIQLWFILTGIFLILEIVFGFTIVFLFAALASFTLGFMVYINFINPDNFIMQLAYFFGFTVFWTLIAYTPLKNFIKAKNQNNYQNIIGSTAEVVDTDLAYGIIGHVKWSGSIFKAKIVEESTVQKIPMGSLVTIVEVKENIFIVKLK